jgi:hypothetical protein
MNAIKYATRIESPDGYIADIVDMIPGKMRYRRAFGDSNRCS